MGFASVATHVIWGVAILGAFTATLDAFESDEPRILEAQEARASFARERQSARFPDATFCFLDNLMTLRAMNGGTTTLDAGAVTLVVDGVVATGFTRAVEGADSAVWGPGDTAVFTLATATDPARVVAYTERGAPMHAAKTSCA